MGNRDFEEFFALLNARQVEFLVIGGVAYNHYALPRATKDIDVWVRPSEENCSLLIGALRDFGFPTDALEAKVLAETDQVLILGRAPNRIDLLTHPGGVDWGVAWARRNQTDFDGVPIALVSLDDLIVMKRHAGRPQDLVDIAKLTAVAQRPPK